MKAANFKEALAFVNRLSDEDKDKLILKLKQEFDDNKVGQTGIKKKQSKK